MNRIFHSFYGRISAIFLILILGLGTGSIGIAFRAAGHLFDEVEQLLNREYASSIASELQPLVHDGFTEEGIKGAIHYMMVLNPMVEIYLLDDTGSILAFFAAPDETIERAVIDLVPVHRFIRNETQNLILGDDPRTAGDQKPFSAAPLQLGPDDGYVYVILRGQSYDQSLETLRNSYYLRTGLFTFILAILVTLALGLSLFFVITRRLRFLSQAVRAFERGELDRKIDIRGSDELGALGRTFNEMAASITAAVKQRNELIANISHDLRSPLTSIRGHIETLLLKDETFDTARRREYLETILRNVSSFQGLLEQLFELVRLETRQVRPFPESFHLAELAQDIVLKLKSRADAAGIALSVDHGDDVPMVEADIGLTERVFTNLLENAIRYTPAGGTVSVSLEREGTRPGARVVVTVADTGPGITPEALPHVFERFYRADKSRDRGKAGTGLGLTIVKEIVELHGGTIDATSEPGSGATFRFSLPVTVT